MESDTKTPLPLIRNVFLVGDSSNKKLTPDFFRFRYNQNGEIYLHLLKGKLNAELLTYKTMTPDMKLLVQYSFKQQDRKVTIPQEPKFPFLPELYEHLCPVDWDQESLLVSWFKAAKEGNEQVLVGLRKVFGTVIGVDVKNEIHQSALMLCCKFAHQKCVEFLLDCGASLNYVTNEASDNAFMYSMMRQTEENFDLTRWLLTQKGADPYVLNVDGGTLLHHAVFWGNLPVVQLLVLEGVDETECDSNGNDPVAALPVSAKLVSAWIREEDIWELDKAEACANWLEKEAPKLKLERQSRKEKRINSKKISVMLSYSWDNKKTILMIKNDLERRGFRVWLDDDHMTGSTLAVMADAVETADIVCIAISSKYQSSNNCRMEAEYACQKRKIIVPLKMESFEPTSWLGLVVGSKLWVKYFDYNNFMKQMDLLEEQLHRQLSQADGGIPVQKGENLAIASPAHKMEQATVSEVTDWLKKNNLSELVGKFQKLHIDGECLLELQTTLETNSPMHEFLISKLTTTPHLIMKFHRALRSL
eukprot:Lithocolla_globosa_v1_NODE_2613_length_1934_cov_73.319851.p1 type:complete len:532 gc:universal NODE_2613_length_1934_cov_73.319851:136-1731(+)